MRTLLIRTEKIKIIDASHPFGLDERMDIEVMFNGKIYEGLLKQRGT